MVHRPLGSPSLSAAVEAALHDESQRAEGDLPVGFLLISEWASPDGGRYLRYTTSDEVMFWDVFGYLRDASLYYEQQRVESAVDDD